MHKLSKARYLFLLTVVLLLPSVLTGVSPIPAKAASGTITTNPVVFQSATRTTTVFNGGTFGSGVTVEIYLSTSITFTTASPTSCWCVGTVTLPAGQTTFSNTAVTLTSIPTVTAATTYYIAATDMWAVGSPTWTTYETVTVTTQVLSVTLSPSSQSPGSSVTVTGSGFTAGRTAIVYLGMQGGTVLASTTVAADGTISTSFTVPNLAEATYQVVVQQSDTLLTATTPDVSIMPAVMAPFDIAGTAGETFTITAAGLKGGKTLPASTTAAPGTSICVGGIPTYQATATTGSDGTLSVTVTLTAAIGTTGFQTVVFTYSDGTSDTIVNAIVVSTAPQTTPTTSTVTTTSPTTSTYTTTTTSTITTTSPTTTTSTATTTSLTTTSTTTTVTVAEIPWYVWPVMVGLVVALVIVIACMLVKPKK